MPTRDHNGRYITKEVFEAKLDLLKIEDCHIRELFEQAKESHGNALQIEKDNSNKLELAQGEALKVAKDGADKLEKAKDEALKLAKENNDAKQEKMNELREDFSDWRRVMTETYASKTEQNNLKDKVIILEKAGGNTRFVNAFWAVLGAVLIYMVLSFLGRVN